MSFRQLFVDPGAKPGFALFHDGALVNWGDDWESFQVPDGQKYDELVLEDQHAAASIYRNGRKVRVSRKSQGGLFFVAGRLFERFTATAKYRVPILTWRGALWPGVARVPKHVILARLEKLVAPEVWAGQTDDTREAIGIGLAWQRMTAAARKKCLVKT